MDQNDNHISEFNKAVQFLEELEIQKGFLQVDPHNFTIYYKILDEK